VAGGAGRILVIDDDPLTRETLIRTLQRANYRVVGTGDGDEAFALVEQDPFDLVIAGTPPLKRRGLEMLSALRRHSPQLKILAVASHTGLDQTARKFGATHTLVKPFAKKELLRAIESALLEH
jgi:response regulator NasT